MDEGNLTRDSFQIPNRALLTVRVKLFPGFARAMGWDDPEGEGSKQARKYLHTLCDYRILRLDHALPPKGWPCGTNCFQPSDYDLVDLFEGERQLTVVREEAA